MADRSFSNFYQTTLKSKLVPMGQYDGTVRVHYDTMTTDGTETVGSKLLCGKLECGSMFLFAQLVYGAMGAGTSLTLGDNDNPSRYLNAPSVSTAGVITAIGLPGMGYRNTTQAPIDLFLTVGGATLAAGQQIEIAVYSVRA